MHPRLQLERNLTRRQLLGRTGAGVGLAALAGLLGKSASASDALAGLPHFPAKAKRVIYLMQTGAPTHVDLFDYKPSLYARRGQLLPPSVQMGQRLTTMTQNQRQLILPGIAPFQRFGKSGTWLSSLLPHTGSIADEVCFIKSMHTEAINHAPAVSLFLSGAEMPGRPSMGAWLSYGLGSMTRICRRFSS